MRRCINDQFNFVDRSNKNKNVMSYTGAFGYPIQDTNAVGKYIAINFYDFCNQSYNFRVKFPNAIYEEYQDIIPNIYNKKENLPVIFEIVRFDITAPYRAILVSIYGHVIVTTTEEINNILYYDTSYCNNIKSKIESLGKQMYINIITTSEEDFINEFSEEKMHIYPAQYDEIFGKRVYIEFDNDLESIDYKDTVYPVEKNKYEFTDEMYEEVIERDVSLKNKSRKEIESYPVYYNTHSQSFMNDSLRSMEIGYIIRLDINDPDGQVVVMSTDSFGRRYYCLDEAKFYYDTENKIQLSINPPLNYIEEKTIYNTIHFTSSISKIRSLISTVYSYNFRFLTNNNWNKLKDEATAAGIDPNNCSGVVFTFYQRPLWGGTERYWLFIGLYPTSLILRLKVNDNNDPAAGNEYYEMLQDGISRKYNCVEFCGYNSASWSKMENKEYISVSKTYHSSSMQIINFDIFGN